MPPQIKAGAAHRTRDGARRWDRALLWALGLFLGLTIAGCQAHAVWWLLQ